MFSPSMCRVKEQNAQPGLPRPFCQARLSLSGRGKRPDMQLPIQLRQWLDAFATSPSCLVLGEATQASAFNVLKKRSVHQRMLLTNQPSTITAAGIQELQEYSSQSIPCVQPQLKGVADHHTHIHGSNGSQDRQVQQLLHQANREAQRGQCCSGAVPSPTGSSQRTCSPVHIPRLARTDALKQLRSWHLQQYTCLHQRPKSSTSRSCRSISSSS